MAFFLICSIFLDFVWSWIFFCCFWIGVTPYESLFSVGIGLKSLRSSFITLNSFLIFEISLLKSLTNFGSSSSFFSSNYLAVVNGFTKLGLFAMLSSVIVYIAQFFFFLQLTSTCIYGIRGSSTLSRSHFSKSFFMADIESEFQSFEDTLSFSSYLSGVR